MTQFGFHLKLWFLKAFVCSLLVAAAMSAPADIGYAPAPYAPAPAPYAPAPYHPAPAPYHEEKIPPQPFAYEYGGADEYGRHFAKTETQDEHGVVKGKTIFQSSILKNIWNWTSKNILQHKFEKIFSDLK